MNCGESRARLVELVYEEPGAGERGPLEAHVAACVQCRGELEALRAGRAALARLEEPASETGGVGPSEAAGSAGLRDLDVRRLYHTAAVRAQRQRRWWKRAGLAATVLAGALLAVVAARLRVEVGEGRAVIAWGEAARAAAMGTAGRAHGPEQRGARAEGKVDRERMAVARELAALAERVAGQERAIEELEARVQSVGELAQLATRELLSVDGRNSDELARVRAAVERLRQSTTTALAELRNESDLRWRLTVHELGSRAGLDEVSVVETPAGEE